MFTQIPWLPNWFNWFPRQLVDAVVQLLEALNVWDVSEENVEWVEMAHVGVRILLGFISRKEPEFCATASSKLSKILKTRLLNSQSEVCYILGRLHKAYLASRETGNAAVFTRDTFTVVKYLPQ